MMKYTLILALLVFSTSAKAFKGEQITYSEVRSSLIEFTAAVQDYYLRLQELAKIVLTEQQKNEGLESLTATQICQNMSPTAGSNLDEIYRQFNDFNLLNDQILVYGTNDSLEIREEFSPLFQVFSAENIYQMIALQNEHIRLKSFCDDSTSVLQLDFAYNVVTVKPGDFDEFSKGVQFMLSNITALKSRIEGLGEFEMALPLQVPNGDFECLPPQEYPNELSL